jgi:serpin B
MEKMTAAAPSESFVVCLDRPFVYAIVDLESGVPVFLGVQNSMK